MGEERMVPLDGVELCVRDFGDPEDPALLLVGGMSSSMDWWEDGFCERLAAADLHVVRYDLRDTGRSTSYPPGEPGYTGADLRADVVGLLDVLGIGRAHLVGISMGAAMAQCVAVEHPERLASLTLIATTGGLPGMPDDLPAPAPELLEFFEEAGRRPEPDWSDREAVVSMLVADQRAFYRGGWDEARVRAIVERVVDRSTDIRAMGNHAVLANGPDPEGTLADISVPTLVIHGTADPLFPLPHGEALARAIPGATLLTLDDVGHEPPPEPTWDTVVPAIRRLVAG
jgi:pimeloyl-ACP methyl ester carboxylesterase